MPPICTSPHSHPHLHIAPFTPSFAHSHSFSLILSNAPRALQPTTSAVDDVFFLLRKSAERAFATSNVAAGCAVLNHINAILTRDFRAALELGIRAALGDANAAHAIQTSRSAVLSSSSSALASSSQARVIQIQKLPQKAIICNYHLFSTAYCTQKPFQIEYPRYFDISSDQSTHCPHFPTSVS
jgi:hypothetical protein